MTQKAQETKVSSPDYLGLAGDIIIKSLIKPVNNKTTLTVKEWTVRRATARGYGTNNKNNEQVCTNPECDSPDIINTGSVIVCNSCGATSDHFLVSSWIRTATPYKRITHFKDWLIKSQAKHTLDFDPNFIKDIKDNIPITKLSYFSIRNYLKKRGLFKYYEDIALILQTITGKVHFLLSPAEELFLINKFILINKVYNIFKTKGRKSIISYSFIIRNLIRLFFTKQRQTELNLDFFVLPQPEKVLEYTFTFKKITNYYNW